MIDLKKLKALADETRLRMVSLLLKHNFCVKALANELKLTEATISQHLKILREAGLVSGEKRGYFMHYNVCREELKLLSENLQKMADVKQEPCQSKKRGDCETVSNCPKKGSCDEEQKECCHGE